LVFLEVGFNGVAHFFERSVSQVTKDSQYH